MTEINKKEELNLTLKNMDKALTELRAGLSTLISMGLCEAQPKQLSKLKPMASAVAQSEKASYVPPTREEVAMLVTNFLEAKGNMPMLALKEKYGFVNISSILLKSPEVVEKIIEELKNVK